MSINQKGVVHGMCMDQFIGISLIAFQRPLYPIKIILRRLKTLRGGGGRLKNLATFIMFRNKQKLIFIYLIKQNVCYPSLLIFNPFFPLAI